jgi:hypothetical protein
MRRRRSWGSCEGAGEWSPQFLDGTQIIEVGILRLRMDFASRSPYFAQDDRKNLDLLCDRAAGDAVAGVAGGIGLHVVGFGVDDDAGAAVAEQGMAIGAFVGDVFVHEAEFGLAFGVDGEVVHVAGVMAFGILQSVLFGVGIEVRAGGFEVGGFALGILVNVNGVFAGRKIMEVELEAGASCVIPNKDRAYGFALSVLEFDFSFGCAGKSENCQSDDRGERGKGYRFHAGNYSQFAVLMHLWAMLDSQGVGVYCGKV